VATYEVTRLASKDRDGHTAESSQTGSGTQAELSDREVDMTEERRPNRERGSETLERLGGEPHGAERPGANRERGGEKLADAGLEGAPEGADESARPDVEDERPPDEERALHDEDAVDDPHP
jgi:hypothetical protein